MINHLSALELQGIAMRGGSLEVDGARYSALELQGVAMRLTTGATLRVHNCAGFSALELQGIAMRKPGQVTFS
ncbi:hypothetical protein [Paracoccus sp. SY]|uniref:hypothetical protein n=1 Tax=Paracoccus sp. SY TaxID=1330255 RepID=UPI0011AFCC6E|nr:hypothetical protein [Paracoccus sp. SY]